MGLSYALVLMGAPGLPAGPDAAGAAAGLRGGLRTAGRDRDGDHG
jgi:hypothetical protein